VLHRALKIVTLVLLVIMVFAVGCVTAVGSMRQDVLVRVGQEWKIAVLL
jgi:hypothetical protein